MFSNVYSLDYPPSVSFAGSVEGLTKDQNESVRFFLESMVDHDREIGRNLLHFHHRDLIGGDHEAHQIASELGYFIHIYPSLDPTMDANSVGSYLIYEKDPPDKIAREMIYYTEITLIAPRLSKSQEPFVWELAKEALKKARECYVVYPDGVLESLSD